MEALLMIRLDKYLADMSIGTRQEVKKYIRQGRVKINEDIIKKPEYKTKIKLRLTVHRLLMKHLNIIC